MATIPFESSFALGKGYNSLNGKTLGTIFKTEPQYDSISAAKGQMVEYKVQVIKSAEHLYESLGIDVEIDGNVGPFFSMEGKFSFASKSSFNSNSVFYLLKVSVRNAPIHIKQSSVEYNAEVMQILKDGDMERFRRGFGDSFIEGIITGGEFIALYEMVCTDANTSTQIKAELETSVGTFVSGVDIKAKVESNIERVSKKSSLKVSVHTSGGIGLKQSFKIEDIINTAAVFPDTVKGEYAVPFEVITASYETLPLPKGPNYIALDEQRYELQKYAKDILKYRTIQNDLEYLLSNVDEFYYAKEASGNYIKIEEDKVLHLKEMYTTTGNYISARYKHAIKCASSALSAEPFLADNSPIPVIEDLPKRKEENDAVIIFEEADFKGKKTRLPINPDGYPSAATFNLPNDSISSIVVPKNLQVYIYKDNNFEGQSWKYGDNVSDLTKDGFNEMISSIYVTTKSDPKEKPDMLNVTPLSATPRPVNKTFAKTLRTNVSSELLTRKLNS